MLLAERKALQAVSQSAGIGVSKGNRVMWRQLIHGNEGRGETLNMTRRRELVRCCHGEGCSHERVLCSNIEEEGGGESLFSSPSCGLMTFSLSQFC